MDFRTGAYREFAFFFGQPLSCSNPRETSRVEVIFENDIMHLRIHQPSIRIPSCVVYCPKSHVALSALKFDVIVSRGQDEEDKGKEKGGTESYLQSQVPSQTEALYAQSVSDSLDCSHFGGCPQLWGRRD